MIPWRYVLKMIFTALVISGAVFCVFNCKSSSGREKSGPVAGTSAGSSLEIRDAGSGRVYGEWLLGETGEFSIEFIHSVHQSPVRETFTISEGMIRPLTVRFFSFGAGMQSNLEEGQTVVRDGDALVIIGFSTSFKELNLIVGTVSDHLLYIGDEAISLRDLCGKNAHITLRAGGEN